MGTGKANVITQTISKYSLFLTWMLVGMLIVGVALASMSTLYIREKSISTATTACPSASTVTSQATTTSQTNSSQTSKQSYVCGNVANYTLWHLFSTNGITITIDTTICNFSSTPLYFTSMAGATYHWVATGYTAIYNAQKNSFTIYAQSADYPNNTLLFALSQTYTWNVNWFGLLN
ncbi:unnamed protein product [Adineta ricciae]|uniref:Uncharacterized protein n=1 Tax=Adineta ricciae TaxID=249248 RepID=A0A813TD53_ADIRI|nr:unnamed protein product [Adineta ricciae]